MEFVRRWVFPVVWMVIVGVLAASMAKMAFFSDTAASGDTEVPTAATDQMATVQVARGDVTSTLNLDGKVAADEGKQVTASHAGEVNAIFVADGDRVAKGDRILQVKVPREEAVALPVPAPAPSDSAAAAAAAAAPAEVAPAPTKVTYTFHTLHAPRAGTIRGLSILEGQTVEKGAAVATLSPDTYTIVAPLTPDQQLRLLDRDVKAVAALPSADPVTCPTARIDESVAGEESASDSAPQMDPMTGMPMAAAETSAELRCPVPRGEKVVPGLTVKVTLELGSAQNVLTVPNTAVEGSGSKGAVFLPATDGGEPTRQGVTLGLRDEEKVEVQSGLKADATVLLFAPGVDNSEDAAMMNGMVP